MSIQEVEFPPVLAADDLYRSGEFLPNKRDLWAGLVVGPGAKAVGAQDIYSRHTPNIPKGSTILRAKMTLRSGAAETQEEAFFPLLRVGFLRHDGWWNSSELHKSYQSQLHFISVVREADDAPIFTSRLPILGPDLVLRKCLPGSAFTLSCGS